MSPSIFVWLTPALAALFLYGVGQGLVKKYIEDVPPARFCLFFVFAKATVNVGYFLTQDHPPLFTEVGTAAAVAGILAYILDGAGWILYFKSIVHGPITIVGTLSAAYPAATVLFASIFLHESLAPLQYVGVLLIISSCIGLSYAPDDGSGKKKKKRWIFYALLAVLLWGAAQTIVKYSYSLPNASDANLAIYNTIGGFLTLGIYGFLFGRRRGSEKETGQSVSGEWFRSFLPMGMMAGGDLGVIIATATGPVSLVTPITAAYPVVTLGFAALILKEHITRFQWFCVGLILIGMYLSPGASL